MTASLADNSSANNTREGDFGDSGNKSGGEREQCENDGCTRDSMPTMPVCRP